MDEQDVLDGQGFYEVMQRYRYSGIHAGKRPQGKESDVVDAFENVKDWIRAHYANRLSDRVPEGKDG